MTENQQLRSSDVISLLALIGAVAVIVVSIVSNAFMNRKSHLAQREMSLLAQQILSDETTTIAQEDISDSRSPASTKSLRPLELLGPEGQIAQDPWGKPYSYRVYQSEGKVIGILVWSFGPNKTADTHLGESPSQVFLGDDMGIFQSIQ